MTSLFSPPIDNDQTTPATSLATNITAIPLDNTFMTKYKEQQEEASHHMIRIVLVDWDLPIFIVIVSININVCYIPSNIFTR
jgi:hypothetical protein